MPSSIKHDGHFLNAGPIQSKMEDTAGDALAVAYDQQVATAALAA